MTSTTLALQYLTATLLCHRQYYPRFVLLSRNGGSRKSSARWSLKGRTERRPYAWCVTEVACRHRTIELRWCTLMSLVVHLPRPGASGPRKCAITLGEKDQEDEEQQGGSDWNEHCSRRTRMTQCDSFQVLTNYRRMISGLIRCCDA